MRIIKYIPVTESNYFIAIYRDNKLEPSLYTANTDSIRMKRLGVVVKSLIKEERASFEFRSGFIVIMVE